jgi:replicative DNA helicase
MIENLQELESKLEQVEKEVREADWELGFEETLKDYHGADEVISFAEAKKIANETKESTFCIKTNLPSLDSFIDGFKEGNLVVVSAPTGQGKTTLCQTFTKEFAKNGVESLWFSYEVPVKQFLAKYGDNLPVSYLPKNLVSNKLVWVERKIVEAIAKYGIQVVFIDHLHYLFDLSGRNNASLEIGDLMRNLKKISIKYNIVIFLVAHLTKTKFEESIGLEDIRDSSFISQEADYVIIIKRKAAEQKIADIRKNGVIYTDEALLSVCKNRFNGKLGSVKLLLKDGLFEELSLNYGNETF